MTSLYALSAADIVSLEWKWNAENKLNLGLINRLIGRFHPAIDHEGP